ncbi:phosphoribosyltransferase-like protein [Fimicolochytrium jonesii]|uniref:phosphoribosyltransferase-like protein n=1 Tax=Fimicolochytrium jonesii TaxID=1396493 RepID=UPI0022FEBB69|nr:phosphoribosyltransferase-like protein [Fimicolochytrium jonesii]KAI8821351.1 phosphoribosyltransferase-like protein [Fimicolochytrium jonesii]
MMIGGRGADKCRKQRRGVSELGLPSETGKATAGRDARATYSSPFPRRVDAGNQLAADPRLGTLAGRDDTIILALPRGGVPVAFQIAQRLNLPLDLMLVRKIGLPFHEETAMGAIAMGDVTYLNPAMIAAMRVTDAQVQAVLKKETAELHRRNMHYRQGKPYPDLKDKNVIIVDGPGSSTLDGIATGSTLRAAILSVREHGPTRVVAAAPVGPPDSVAELAKIADEVVCLQVKEPFNAVGMWYQLFPQTEDEEVLELLHRAESFGRKKEE